MAPSPMITRRSALGSLRKAGGTLGLVGLALWGGCAGPWSAQRDETPRTLTVTAPMSAASLSVPMSLPPAPSEIPLANQVEWQTDGIHLTLDHVRCRAATSAVLARMTEIERGLAAEFFRDSPCVSANIKCLQQELLILRTIDQGNEAATQALNLSLQLSEAEGQLPFLEKSLEEIQSMRDDLAELKRRQLPVDMEPGPLDRQYLSTREQQTTLKAGIAQGRAQLAVLMDEEAPASLLVNLEADFPLSVPPRADAVQIALEMRPELRTLRTMLCRLDAQTLPMARAVLQQYEASLGTVQPMGLGVTFQQVFSCLPFLGPDRCPLPSQVREVEVRTVQLSEILRKREQALTAEVDAALFALDAAIEKRESARERVTSWETELDRLTEKQTVDETITVFDLAETRLNILKTKAELVTLTVDCLKAQVQLWAAQGVTAAGCGLPGHDSAWCEICPPALPDETPSQLPQEGSENGTTPLLAPEPKITPMSGNFRPSLLPITHFQSCRPARKSSW